MGDPWKTRHVGCGFKIPHQAVLFYAISPDFDLQTLWIFQTTSETDISRQHIPINNFISHHIHLPDLSRLKIILVESAGISIPRFRVALTC